MPHGHHLQRGRQVLRLGDDDGVRAGVLWQLARAGVSLAIAAAAAGVAVPLARFAAAAEQPAGRLVAVSRPDNRLQRLRRPQLLLQDAADWRLRQPFRRDVRDVPQVLRERRFSDGVPLGELLAPTTTSCPSSFFGLRGAHTHRSSSKNQQ